jgi:hypothetical protein
MKTYTPEDVKDAGACYSLERLRELWAGRERLSIEEIFALKIPLADRCWAIRKLGAEGANLTHVYLWCANLRGANLKGARLTGANLEDADLADADLTDADLTDADLTDANLTGANLTGANLTGAKGLGK